MISEPGGRGVRKSLGHSKEVDSGHFYFKEAYIEERNLIFQVIGSKVLLGKKGLSMQKHKVSPRPVTRAALILPYTLISLLSFWKNP